jgi:hypothetical protein
VLVAFLLSASVACASPDDAPDPTENATALPAQGMPGSPDVVITTPEHGSTVDDGNVKVRVKVERFGIVEKMGDPAAAGTGHIHYYLDVQNIPTSPGAPAVVADESRYHASAKRSYTWKDVAPGVHTFSVQLVNNDHTPLSPPITAATTVTVERS